MRKYIRIGIALVTLALLVGLVVQLKRTDTPLQKEEPVEAARPCKTRKGCPTTSTSTSMITNTSTTTAVSTTTVVPTGTAPPRGGYFTLKPTGSWSSLPSGEACKSQVHYSDWEPRPDNYKRNHVVVDPAAVRASFSARPYDSSWTNWNTWVLPRVDGQFSGTTDEIFQWAACKWGLPDDVLRGIAVRESTWYQYETYPSNRCVLHFSCGDIVPTANVDTQTYCTAIAQFGYDYQRDYSPGICPKTFGIVGVMDWEAPSWGQMKDNQNGTFPFNRNSTAFAVDYIGAYLRGCSEGWITWLNTTGGDLWGCVGSWYSGDWHSTAANSYISNVQNEINNYRWLDPSWPSDRPGCDPTYGCPGPDTL